MKPHQSASGEAPGAAGAATTVHPAMAAVVDEQGQQSETAGDGNHLSRTLTDGRFSRYSTSRSTTACITFVLCCPCGPLLYLRAQFCRRTVRCSAGRRRGSRAVQRQPGEWGGNEECVGRCDQPSLQQRGHILRDGVRAPRDDDGDERKQNVLPGIPFASIAPSAISLHALTQLADASIVFTSTETQLYEFVIPAAL